MDSTELIGMIAAFFTTIAFLPQAIKVIKTKNTQDLSLSMYSILCTGLLLWLIYGIQIDSLPIIIANGITLILSSTILIVKIKYK